MSEYNTIFENMFNELVEHTNKKLSKPWKSYETYRDICAYDVYSIFQKHILKIPNYLTRDDCSYSVIETRFLEINKKAGWFCVKLDYDYEKVFRFSRVTPTKNWFQKIWE